MAPGVSLDYSPNWSGWFYVDTGFAVMFMFEASTTKVMVRRMVVITRVNRIDFEIKQIRPHVCVCAQFTTMITLIC